MDNTSHFTDWDNMLKSYVSDGKVDYNRWQRESAEDLDRWLNSIHAVDLDEMDNGSAFAFLLNLYNALTIRQVLQKYPTNSIRSETLGIPNWIEFLLFFKKPIYSLNGRSLSLDGIEHGILRKRYTEPRMHFALVCASIGCPLLRDNAYLPAQLSAQLQEDARRFINNPDKVKYDADSNTLYCSRIFKWYKKDFLKQATSIPNYIQSYFTDASFPADVNLKYLPYDWHLNQRTSS